MGVTRCMIYKDASTLVLVVTALLAIGVDQASEWIAHEMVHRDLGSWEEVVGLESIDLFLDEFLDSTRGWFASLFGILTSGAQHALCQFGRGRV